MIRYKGTKTLEVLEGAENYNKWIVDRIAPFIKSNSLEIGAGTGNISSHFLKLKELILTDNDEKLVADLKKKFKNENKVVIKIFDIAKDLKLPRNLFSTVFSVNVLEHIKDDQKALRNINSLLRKRGKIVMLVPAKRFAFNKLDKNLGHYRRYEKQELKVKLENAGFKIETLEYFNMLGLLSWVVRSAISRNHNQLKPSQVKIFDLIVPLLRIIEPKKGLPIGISLIAVAKKK